MGVLARWRTLCICSCVFSDGGGMKGGEKRRPTLPDFICTVVHRGPSDLAERTTWSSSGRRLCRAPHGAVATRSAAQCALMHDAES
jgi:hypothetical protein